MKIIFLEINLLKLMILFSNRLFYCFCFCQTVWWESPFIPPFKYLTKCKPIVSNEVISIFKKGDRRKGSNYTVQHKENSKTKRVDFGKFGGAEHEYEIYFFLSRQVFSAFYILI